MDACQKRQSGGSTMDKTVLLNNQQVIAKEKIRFKSIDEFGLKDVGFIKIDVEGYEEHVIDGALDTLIQSTYPQILFEAWDFEEYKDKKKSLFDKLNKIGYKITSITGYNNMFLAHR